MLWYNLPHYKKSELYACSVLRTMSSGMKCNKPSPRNFTPQKSVIELFNYQMISNQNYGITIYLINQVNTSSSEKSNLCTIIELMWLLDSK